MCCVYIIESSMSKGQEVRRDKSNSEMSGGNTTQWDDNAQDSKGMSFLIYIILCMSYCSV